MTDEVARILDEFDNWERFGVDAELKRVEIYRAQEAIEDAIDNLHTGGNPLVLRHNLRGLARNITQRWIEFQGLAHGRREFARRFKA